MAQLSPAQQRLLNFMLSYGVGVDVPIAAIHEHVGLQPTTDTRMQQQRVGAIISHIQQRAPGIVIRPGVMKRTYRLLSCD